MDRDKSEPHDPVHRNSGWDSVSEPALPGHLCRPRDKARDQRADWAHTFTPTKVLKRYTRIEISLQLSKSKHGALYGHQLMK
jgi:hypothetical protein